MNMFQADVRSPWTYDHCWEVLKYCDKWMIIPQSNPRAPSSIVLYTRPPNWTETQQTDIHVLIEGIGVWEKCQ